MTIVASVCLASTPTTLPDLSFRSSSTAMPQMYARAGVLGLRGQPLVEGRAQDRQGVLPPLGELRGS